MTTLDTLPLKFDTETELFAAQHRVLVAAGLAFQADSLYMFTNPIPCFKGTYYGRLEK